MKWSVLFGVVLLTAVSTCFSDLQAQTPSGSGSSFAQRVTVEAVRNKRTRVQGGDFDDKTDRISFTIKFANSDTRVVFEDCKGEFYVFAQSIVYRNAYQLLGSQKFDFSLPARGTHSVETEEWMTRYDTTGARFGTKYDSWVLIIRNSAGELLAKKSSTPAWIPVAEKMGTLTEKMYYDRDLKPVKNILY